MLERKDLILKGWTRCCTGLFNVLDPVKRCEAMAAVQDNKLEETLVPDEEEADAYGVSSSSESEDERDFSIPIPEGKRSDFFSPGMNNAAGARLDPCLLAMEASGEDIDSDADGLAR